MVLWDQVSCQDPETVFLIIRKSFSSSFYLPLSFFGFTSNASEKLIHQTS